MLIENPFVLGKMPVPLFYGAEGTLYIEFCSDCYIEMCIRDRYMEEKEENNQQQIIEYPGNDPYAAYRELYQTYCKELVDTFGLENTLKQYDYSTDIQVISNARLKKRIFAQMQWERKPETMHWVG